MGVNAQRLFHGYGTENIDTGPILAENGVFRFPGSKKHGWTFYDHILPSRPSVGARVNDINLESLIREERGNDVFRFPRSKKPLTDFLRQ